MSEPRKSGEAALDGTEATEARVDGIGTISLLVSGMAVWGGIGWLLDRSTGHQGLFLPIGILLGLGLAMYMVFVRLHVLGRGSSSNIRPGADPAHEGGKTSADRRSGAAQNRPDSLDSRRKGSP
ncbi:MAG: AtpZ/AtpI family protein [Nocardiopsaceae bacterium]|nr:AtpZ/AtpI family protein [Nocardiopsaceae bacterium]